MVKVKINRVYTRTGDDGTTGLVGGSRAGKDSLRVDTYGEVDELLCHLGACRTTAAALGAEKVAADLASLQHRLFDVGAELATPNGGDVRSVGPADAEELERLIDRNLEHLPELRSFVLPGGSPLNAALHIARAVCRRVERRIVALSRQEKVSKDLIVYVNRMSDLLFAMARAESRRVKAAEYLWEPRRADARTPRRHVGKRAPRRGTR